MRGRCNGARRQRARHGASLSLLAPPFAPRRRRGLVLFETELAKSDEEVSVCRGALYIAMHHYREAVIDADAYVARLEDWGRQLQQHLPPPDQRYTRRLILAINAFMFDTLGFRGAPNSEWSAVENSCLNHVMDARTGIPLTLSMVYLELARSAGLPMVAANLPGHLMIRPAVEDIDVLVDVFNSGAIITVEDAETQLGPLFGPGASIKIDRAFLEDNTPKPRTMLTRMLTNLKQSYFNAKQYDNALLMIEYQAACAPDASIAAMNQRDRGICLYLMGRHLDAIAELKGYLEVFAEAVDRKAIESACACVIRCFCRR